MSISVRTIVEDVGAAPAEPVTPAANPSREDGTDSSRRWPDLDVTVEQLRQQGVSFRGEMVEGKGGRQILAEDPSGNPIELFESS